MCTLHIRITCLIVGAIFSFVFFFSSRRRHTRCLSDWSSDVCSSDLHLSLKIAEKQELLETEVVSERLEKVFGYMEGEIGVLQVEKRIRNRVKRQMEKTQREYYLNEQLKAIQKELGEGEDGRDEMAELEDKINKTKFSKEAHDKAIAEPKKLHSMSPT